MFFKPYSQETLDRVREVDRGLAHGAEIGSRIGRTGRLVRRLSIQAYIKAVEDVGHDAPAEEKEKYFQDNERIYLDVNSQRAGAGLRNRWGRVRERRVYGRGGKIKVISDLRYENGERR